MRQTRRRYPFHIDAWVVLRDHLHAVWTLPPGDSDFSTRWRLIKSRFARSIPKRERLSRVRQSRGERGIWQRRFWEHLIRDDADYARRYFPNRTFSVARMRPHVVKRTFIWMLRTASEKKKLNAQ